MTANFSLSPLAFMQSVWRHRDLVVQMTERDARSRYRGSAGGLIWSIANPLLMLTVYVFFFGQIFPAKWALGGGTGDFALILYVGLLIHGLFAECIIRAPSLIVGQSNLVRKVVFPLELLPVVTIGTALFHLAISWIIWLAFHLLVRGIPPATALLFPVIVLPLLVLTLGLTWALAALGVYLRDIVHVVPVACAILLFASPVFYPLESLTSPFREIVQLSPLTQPIVMARDVLLWGRLPSIADFAMYGAIAAVIAWGGFAWFQATRKGFADVV
jgi:lipopolysaccharide transport system permease protein